MISSARKSATANPFIIYDFYDVIEKIIVEKKLTAKHIRNCDESGFPHDPAKCMAIGPKGEVCYKVMVLGVRIPQLWRLLVPLGEFWIL